MCKSPQAVILGANHHNTYGIVRALYKIGIKPIVVIPEKNGKVFFHNSRYIYKVVYLSKDKIVDWLLKLGKQCEIKIPIYVSSDGLSELVDRNRVLLNEYYYTPGTSSPGRLSQIMDKQEMGKIAESVGLKLPLNSQILTLDNNESNLDTINFPCIIKPLKSINGSKNDIKICNSKEEFISKIQDVNCKDVQVQDFIDKDFEYQLIGLSLDNNTIIIPGVTRLLRAASPYTNTGIVRIENIDNYENIPLEKVSRFLGKIGYVGSFSAEFLRDKQGQDYFMEVNFRNDGNAIVVTAGGVNLPKIWNDYNKGRKVIAEKHRIIKCATAIPFFAMLSMARNDLKSFLKYLIRPHVFMDISFTDPIPFIIQLGRLFKMIASKIIRTLKR